MAKITIWFGILLIALGIFGYTATHEQSATALIPAGVGLLLAILGFLARTNDAKQRMMIMHIAVTVGLLGFLGSVSGIFKYIEYLRGKFVLHVPMQQAKTAMALILLAYVLLCVRSFIAARRARKI